MLTQQNTTQNVHEKNLILADVLRDDFQSLFKLDYESFIKEIQKLIPESLLLKGTANVSAEGIASDKPAKNVFGLTEDEEIRAFAGLLRFKDVINGTEEDYNNFVACQIEMKKPVLSYASFQKMRQYVIATLSTPEDFAAAMWSILCNDLGKVHSVIQAYEQLPNKQHIGHDLLLASLLQEKPELFPGFDQLTKEHQAQIIAGYASGCDISMLEQLELPQISVAKLKALDKKTLDLYILHTIFDVSGAAAHFKSNGSLTLHEETWNFFNAIRQCLEKLHQPQENTIEDVYAEYVKFRGKCVGIENDSPENIALIRIASLARLATPEQGKMLSTVWEKLPEDTKHILVRELNMHGGQGLRAIFIGYGVAMLLNPQGALQKELTEAAKTMGLQVSSDQRSAATQEGLKIGLSVMAKAFENARNIIGNDPKEEIFVAECDEIARFLSREPRKALGMDFSATKNSERRVDFTLVPRPELQKEANDTVFKPLVAAKVSNGPSLFNAKESEVKPVSQNSNLCIQKP